MTGKRRRNAASGAVGPEGQDGAVAPVGAGHSVVGLHCRRDTDRDCLLAVVKVGAPAYEPLEEQLLDTVFERPDHAHLA